MYVVSSSFNELLTLDRYDGIFFKTFGCSIPKPDNSLRSSAEINGVE